MTLTGIIENFNEAKCLYYRKSRALTTAKSLALAFVMASFTALTARICVKLPFTPVPVTGQVFGVLLSGVVCGGLFGSVSQIIYVALAASGLPWFAFGARGSLNYLLGPTGGYLLGFIIAPLIIGYFTDARGRNQRFIPQTAAMLAGAAVIYFCGAGYLAYLLKYSFAEAVTKGILPFIFIDIVKVFLAGALSSFILPKKTFE